MWLPPLEEKMTVKKCSRETAERQQKTVERGQ
jgi:hypothetical protein